MELKKKDGAHFFFGIANSSLGSEKRKEINCFGLILVSLHCSHLSSIIESDPTTYQTSISHTLTLKSEEEDFANRNSNITCYFCVVAVTNSQVEGREWEEPTGYAAGPFWSGFKWADILSTQLIFLVS